MPSATPAAPVRVIVRLPYNRPPEGYENPPRIEWNAEKENVLWEVITRSRASDSAGPDWPGLAAHLAVPLPYLLFRAQTRYEEDLRGLQLHTAIASVPSAALKSPDEEDRPERPDLMRRLSGRTATGSAKLSSSSRLTSPLAVRARLNSLGYDSRQRLAKVASSSVATLQNVRDNGNLAASHTLSASESESESDDEAAKAEEEERQREEQEALDRKLAQLKEQMTNDAVGLVRDERISASQYNNGRQRTRGREVKSPTSPLRNAFQRDPSSSDLNSSTSSPQGSIPSIPSPTESQSHLFAGRQVSRPTKSHSPPALTTSPVRGQPIQYKPLAFGITNASDRSSTQGSTASSFSDIESTSLSQSALESAYMSNIRGTGSRLTAFARSQFSRRPSGMQQ